MTDDFHIKSLLDRVQIDPAVMVGKPTVRGYRITVEQILTALASGLGYQELKEDYPFLEREDIEACLHYAAKLVEEHRVYILKSA
jgi:uncharacterized protein (DUF433 family)